jgi:spermidine/putrescine transport system permease protein
MESAVAMSGGNDELLDLSTAHRQFVDPSAEGRKGLVLISAPFLYAFILLAFPILSVFAHSFWTQNYLTIDYGFTLENYRIALTEPLYQQLLLRSLRISLTVGVATILLAFPMAYFISFYGGQRKGLLLFLVTLPFWTSYLLRILSWKIILGKQGALNTALMSAGIIDEPIASLIYNSNAVILTLAHSWVAFAILPIFVTLEKIDRTLLEAATDLGDGPFMRFVRITLPLSATGIVSALLIVMIPTVGDYVTPKLVGGSEGIMIANAIQSQFGRASNWPLGAALSVVTMASVGLMSAVLFLAIQALKRFAR